MKVNEPGESTLTEDDKREALDELYNITETLKMYEEEPLLEEYEFFRPIRVKERDPFDEDPPQDDFDERYD